MQYMFLKKFILAGAGLCGGMLIAGGLFTVLLSVGLIPRFAGKMHTNRKVFLYEEMVIFGALLGTVLSVFPGCQQWGEAAAAYLTDGLWQSVGTLLLVIYGMFAGFLSERWHWRLQRCSTVSPFLQGG